MTAPTDHRGTLDDGRELLITTWEDGAVEARTRPTPSATWSAPVVLREAL